MLRCIARGIWDDGGGLFLNNLMHRLRSWFRITAISLQISIGLFYPHEPETRNIFIIYSQFKIFS